MVIHRQRKIKPPGEPGGFIFRPVEGPCAE
nr:MAG TPA: hypothetical protein [Caudoviricetes sp.]